MDENTKLGRPAKILDPIKVAQMIGKGFTVQFVADFFDVSERTLYANYSQALEKGYNFRNGCLQAKQYKTAMTGNVTMQIWLGKQWLKQTDKVEVKDGRKPLGLGLEQLESTSENTARVC